MYNARNHIGTNVKLCQIIKRSFKCIAIGLVLSATRLAAQTPVVLHAFSNDGPDPAAGFESFTNADGFNSTADLVLSGNILYGTTQLGGANGYGTVYSVHTDGTCYKVLYTFTGGADGAIPHQDLVVSGNMIYGTVDRGTNESTGGSIFSLTTNGDNFSTVYTFLTNEIDSDGVLGNPNGGLTLCNGTLYGTAYQGGITNSGSIFSVTTNGYFTLLHRFEPGTDGGNPLGVLVLTNGTLYGTARNGGSNGVLGSVYSISTNGENFTVLHMFSSGTNDGHLPQGGVILCGNMLYGTTFAGGTYNRGTVFVISTNGTSYSILHSFNPATGEGVDGRTGLVMAGNTLYGIAAVYGGTSLSGSIYSVNTDGSSFTTVYGFSPPSGVVIGGTNAYGSTPDGILVMSGNVLYGTTPYGGVYGNGTIFSLPVVPSISSLNVAETNVTLNAIDGIEGETCVELASPNLTLPLNQWTPMATDVLSSGGNFTFTNVVNSATSQQFYLLQTTVP
jgi:uncharacterized repeat protein (TIGR03803 family)